MRKWYKKIGRFVFKQIDIIVFCFDNQLHGFFAHFLGNFVYAFFEERVGIGIFRIRCNTLFNGVFQRI